MQRNKLGDAIAISNLKLSITHWPTDREMLGDAIAPKNTFNTEWHIFSHLPHTKPNPPLLSIKSVTNSCHGEMFWRFGEIFWCFAALVKCFDLFTEESSVNFCNCTSAENLPVKPLSPWALLWWSCCTKLFVFARHLSWFYESSVFISVSLLYKKKSISKGWVEVHLPHTHTPQPHPTSPPSTPKGQSAVVNICSMCKVVATEVGGWGWGSYIVCGCHRRTSATLISALSPLHWQKAQLQQQNVLLVANWKSWNCIRIAKQRELGHYETAVVSQRNGKLTYFFADFLQSNICSGVPKMTNIR